MAVFCHECRRRVRIHVFTSHVCGNHIPHCKVCEVKKQGSFWLTYGSSGHHDFRMDFPYGKKYVYIKIRDTKIATDRTKSPNYPLRNTNLPTFSKDI